MRLCCGNPFKPTIWEYKKSGEITYLKINNYNNLFNSNSPKGLNNYQKDDVYNLIYSYINRMVKCCKCTEEINPLRIKALPDTKVCVKCSDTSRWYVRNIISGKTTYCETEIIKDPESARTIAAMDRRTGWGSNLYKVR